MLAFCLIYVARRSTYMKIRANLHVTKQHRDDDWQFIYAMQTERFPTSTLYLEAASCSGVNCHRSIVFTLAPAFRSISVTSKCPYEQALCRGTKPLQSAHDKRDKWYGGHYPYLMAVCTIHSSCELTGTNKTDCFERIMICASTESCNNLCGR